MPNPTPATPLKCADLFCGIGGFHIAAAELGHQVVFACDIDPHARKAYQRNFGITPAGDITQIADDDIPDHDLLFAGFPCQPFSIIGQRNGFADPRGELFFEIERIARSKRPKGIVLENVKQLATAQKGQVIKYIHDALEDIGYTVDYKILNALDFGLPQKRERVIIVAALTPFHAFPWPNSDTPMTPLASLLEPSPDPKHFVSERIKLKRREAHTSSITPAIWHENKGGNISSHPYSCALRAGASYNYLLVDGERRPTPRELLRLQGFPDSFQIVCNDSQTRKQAGNAVPVPIVKSAIQALSAIIQPQDALSDIVQPLHPPSTAIQPPPLAASAL